VGGHNDYGKRERAQIGRESKSYFVAIDFGKNMILSKLLSALKGSFIGKSLLKSPWRG